MARFVCAREKTLSPVSEKRLNQVFTPPRRAKEIFKAMEPFKEKLKNSLNLRIERITYINVLRGRFNVSRRRELI